GGWLAVATKPNKNNFKYPWSPVNSKAQIAILSEPSDEWGKVKPGTKFLALAPGLKQEVKFRKLGAEPYGCDNNATKMPTFTAAKSFPEGAVWILPSGTQSNVTALNLQPVNLATIPTNILPANRRKSSDARAWKAGQTTIIQQKTSNLKVKLTVLVNTQVIFTDNQEKYFFEGAEKTPVNLTEAQEPGISYPIGVFQLNANQPPVIAFWEPGYEGNGFTVLASVKGKIQKIEAGSAYFCAF
ncbi:MAG TPA: hypothetical protein VK203_03560, partial [Nostocaceae cyanobacterium]|nr:hypothetical protein [Nostocaceae cyanobacterium]